MKNLDYFMSYEMSELSALANKYGTDKGTNNSSDHGYMTIYDLVLSPLRNSPISFVEIGVFHGKSILAWREYFSHAKIYGIDISKDSLNKINGIDNVFPIQANQENREQLLSFAEEHGPFDVIIDDGGHSNKQQQISFACLFPYVASGGIYIIEDLDGFYDVNDQYIQEEDDDSFLMLYSLGMNKCLGDTAYHMKKEEVEYIENNLYSVGLYSGTSSELTTSSGMYMPRSAISAHKTIQWTSVIRKI